MGMEMTVAEGSMMNRVVRAERELRAENADLRARLAAVEAFCRDYPRSAKYPDYEGGYESALDDVLEVIAARGEGTR